MKNLKKLFCSVLVLALLLSCTAFAELPTVDRSGNPVSIPEDAKRIISLAPATSQILEELGVLDRVIAVDTYTPVYIPDTAALPQFDMMAPDIERIAMLEPDIVFTTGMSYIDDNPFSMLTEMGICVVDIPSSMTIADVREDIVFTAACLGMEKEGKVIADELQVTIDALAAIGATIEEKKTVMFEIAAMPYIYSFGSGVFLDEMITLLGARNVFAEYESWMSVTEESAVAANPDVIFTSVDYIDDPVGEILSRPGWDCVTAVANADVYYIDNAASSLPNHHIVDAMIEMAVALYPEAYAAYIAE